MTESWKKLDHSDLGDELSIEFPVCSIAASELNNAVEQYTTQSNTPPLNYRVLRGDGIDEGHIEHLTLSTLFGDKGQLDIGEPLPVSLVYARPRRSETSLLTIQPSQAKPRTTPWNFLLRRSVQAQPNTETPSEDRIPPQFDGRLMLCCMLQDDFLLPIATFDRRENGQCSYIQLGNEINDDEALYLTQDDDKTSRLAVIEALRETVGPKKYSLSPIAKNHIKQLIKTEMKRQGSAVDRQYERILASKWLNMLKQKNAGKTQNIVIFNPDRTTQTKAFRVRDLTQTIRLEDDRRIKLALLRDAEHKTNNSRVSLALITRENVAIRLATADSGSNTIQLEPLIGDDEPVASKTEFIKSTIVLMDLKTNTPIVQPPYHQASFNGSITDWLAYPELYDPLNSKEYPGRSDIHEARLEQIRLECLRDNINSTYNSIIIAINKCVNTTCLGELGATDNEQELLMHVLHKLSGLSTLYRGRLDGVAVGKIVGSADVESRITRDGSRYSLQSFGRPSFMPDYPYTPISKLSLSLDTTQGYDPKLNQEQRVRLAEKYQYAAKVLLQLQPVIE